MAVLVGWGVAGLLSVLQLVATPGISASLSMMAVLFLLYSPGAVGPGQEMVIGAAFVAVVVALGMYASATGLGPKYRRNRPC